MKSRNHLLNELREGMMIAFGLVLIWRGIWLVLDGIDAWLFGGNHAVTGVVGVLLGLLVLYLPRRNLDALERL